MSEAGQGQAVADGLWARVRELSARARPLEAAAATGELDADGEMLLARLRLRLSRAVERAELADRLADQLHDLGPS